MWGITRGISTDDNFKRILTSEKIKKKQTLYFALRDSSGHEARAYCISNFNAKEFSLGDNPNSVLNIFLDILGVGDESSHTFLAYIFNGPDSSRWELVVDNTQAQQSPKKYKGYLSQSKEHYYTIAPLSKVVSKKGKVGTMPFGSAGFEIRTQDDMPVAAVSLIDKGVIYLTEVTDCEKILLANACAALLLQEQLE